MSASNADDIINSSGLAQFDAITLEKMMAGKQANVSPSISELSEGFDGSAAPQDLEMMMQMLNLYFTAPRKDKDAFEALKAKDVASVENNLLSPESVFADTIQKVMSCGNYRTRTLTKAILDEINLDDAYRIYKERFADAGDFTFFFVGNIDEATFKPLVEQYIASLPSKGKKEMWKDRKIETPKGIVKRTVKKGVEPKSAVRLTYTGPYDWSVKSRTEARAVMNILNIMMRETMREDKGGVYGVGAGFNPIHYPTSKYMISIRFGCAPENVDMLISTAKEQIAILKKDGPSQKNLDKTKETMHRELETSLRDNGFWLNVMNTYYTNGDSYADFLKIDKIIDGITPQMVKELTNKYFNDANYDEFTLYPEK